MFGRFCTISLVSICILGGIFVIFSTKYQPPRAENGFLEIIPSLDDGVRFVQSTLFPVPCATPISYSIGVIDPRFGISRIDFQDIIFNAEAIWEKPIGKNLFIPEDDGDVVINLIYDSRQDSTNRLQGLGLQIETTKESFDELMQRYESIKTTYVRAEKQLDELVTQYNARAGVYEKEVAYWNKKGGAPKHIFDQLELERKELNILSETLSAKRQGLNELVPTINAFISVLNRLAQELNVSIGEFNTMGREVQEFQEGVYVRDGASERIDIFEFATRKQLLRVLAHEFGHALGLEHLENPLAIMYKRNQATNETLTKDDLVALRKKCQLTE